MSFLGGAECSTAGNPLSQFSKHVHDDNSLQRDRLVARGPNGTLGGFRSAGRNGPQDEMMNSFAQQAPEMPLEHGPMSQVRLDPAAAQGAHLRAQSASPTWADDFQRGQSPMEAGPFNAPPGAHFSADEFAKFRQMGQQPSSSRQSPMPSAQQQHRPMMGVGMMNMGMNRGMMSQPMFQPMYSQQQFQPMHHEHQDVQGKGKGKVVELDDHKWEEQFAQIELQDKQDEEEAAAMEPELNKEDQLHEETGYGDLESIWNGIQAEQASLQEIQNEEDYTDMKWDNSDWNKFGDWDMNGRMGSDPTVEEYLFEEENIFKDQVNPFEEGVRIMNEGGNLSLAALAFEAAAQKDPKHVEAWVQLGSAQAQNEKEEAAIRALEHAVSLDPNNLPALMGLAVSYTNEGYDSTAYRTLERWLSVKYPSIISPDQLSSAAEMGFTDRQQLHEKVTDLFIQAAQLSPDGEHMDPDVQVGLGVLFYGAEEYDKAVDCFSAALASSEQGTSNQRSQVHLLWNRLGATLANSGRSEEAIAAYEKALSIHANFVRARYNLGVSCINIGCHAEAAAHLLAALSMHKEVEKQGREKAREILGGAGGDVSDERIDRMTTQNRSTTLYDTLRRVFGQMGRRDLAEKVIVGMDPEMFRGEFDF
ncbi:uncharacterized protein E0L32_009714 [Thyridium curvatum]|uniref:Peroxisomal targeting signal receptor n=1 Tax=Thyridium curvatum TaxID=1093900 RepID=A0A507AQJ5_9PEZI|nr:uncharacterized protein E0L32_009714 [Thyridium curvatum]TPX08774.1 hypothetical protein E0L32_009714 [Thyridium curvatum]